MPARNGEFDSTSNSVDDPAAQSEDALLLARLCHPSTRITNYLLGNLGLGIVPPEIIPVSCYEVEAELVLPLRPTP